MAKFTDLRSDQLGVPVWFNDDRQKAVVGLLERYDEAVKVRPALAEAYEAANRGEGSYEEPDEMRADLDEDLAEIADALVALLRKEV